jgi:hypothetical protein
LDCEARAEARHGRFGAWPAADAGDPVLGMAPAGRAKPQYAQKSALGSEVERLQEGQRDIGAAPRCRPYARPLGP